MPVAPTPADVYERAVKEGRRRLGASFLELVAVGFNAGFTIVFGVAAYGILHGLVEPRFGPEMAKVAGAAGFGLGLLFLIVSRAELFTENFFDPVATAIDERASGLVVRLLRLWLVVLVLNLVGGAVLTVLLSIDGVMPAAAEHSLRLASEEIVAKPGLALFVNALVGGALVTLLSFLLQSVDTVLGRMIAAAAVGFLLAVGPFAHVVVTAMHLLFGGLAGAKITLTNGVAVVAITMAGNVIGGLGFVTLSHIAQARSDEK